LFLQPHAQAMFAQFPGANIDVENSKPESPVALLVFLHGEVSLNRGGVYTRRELS
jgi:hypothetical protein